MRPGPIGFAELREASDLTQVELAARLHVSQNRVSRIEHGDMDRAAQVDTLRLPARWRTPGAWSRRSNMGSPQCAQSSRVPSGDGKVAGEGDAFP
ncbi:helix-turn-helix domain-containing protein [Arthrobacter sp. FW306-2-2C-D06B]|uniref:helix-turn-helix domain-containing protein n=1 Tax=Arthrobacter sp. FW306-2-2C-D06B TaxID=2879618 RepID=UPI003FA4427D|nr:helix-turn-helix transcriptional regulator [Arthrobacter sp. FW306-2-2C-D06B]